jgi:hypothetical protein
MVCLRHGSAKAEEVFKYPVQPKDRWPHSLRTSKLAGELVPSRARDDLLAGMNYWIWSGLTPACPAPCHCVENLGGQSSCGARQKLGSASASLAPAWVSGT